MGYFVSVMQEHREARFKRLLHVVIFTSGILHIVGGFNILFHPLWCSEERDTMLEASRKLAL